VLNERPGLAWAAVGAVFLLLVLWGGTHALRTWWGIVLLGALLAIGVARCATRRSESSPAARPMPPPRSRSRSPEPRARGSEDGYGSFQVLPRPGVETGVTARSSCPRSTHRPGRARAGTAGQIAVDADQRTAVVLQYFDARFGHRLRCDGGVQTPGTRASVDRGEVKLDLKM